MVGTLDRQSEKEIVAAIEAAEQKTSGEIRVHLKKRLPKGRSVREEAEKTFTRLRMHRTRERNGVLIFVVFDNHEFAILGDSGIHARVGAAFWDETRDRMAALFAEGKSKEGIIAGVSSAGEKLAAYFPCGKDDKNELSNRLT